MRLLRFRHDGDDYTLRVHLDEEYVIAEDDPRLETTDLAVGDPDPAWCVDYRFGGEPPEGVKKADYEQSIKADVTLLAQEELEARQPSEGKGRKIKGEGDPL